jgi:hypothetical protein
MLEHPSRRIDSVSSDIVTFSASITER